MRNGWSDCSRRSTSTAMVASTCSIYHEHYARSACTRNMLRYLRMSYIFSIPFFIFIYYAENVVAQYMTYIYIYMCVACRNICLKEIVCRIGILFFLFNLNMMQLYILNIKYIVNVYSFVSFFNIVSFSNILHISDYFCLYCIYVCICARKDV